jgi:hypothetical protein
VKFVDVADHRWVSGMIIAILTVVGYVALVRIFPVSETPIEQ